MSILETVADRLAQTALDAEESYEDEAIVDVMAEAIKNSSPTLTEAFLTYVRVRRGERRAAAALAAYIDKKGGPQRLPSPERPKDSGGDTAPEVTE